MTAKVRRRWSDGSLLRAFADGQSFPVVDVSLRGPKAAEIGDDLEAVRSWVAKLDGGRRGGSRYELIWTSIGGRHFGRNQVPDRAVVATYEQAWSLLGVRAEVARFADMLALTGDIEAVRAWTLAHPHRAIDLAAEWERLLAAYNWLDSHRGSGRYLREITAPGVDTKFAERHRSVLAGMLGVSSTAPGFLKGLGLRAKPELVRLRVSPGLGLPSSMSELAVRADELADLSLAPRSALVIENEITYLSVDVHHRGVVLWGKGFDVDKVGRLPWLADVTVDYWGDLDTHGFAILDRLRAWLPQTRSVLMDRETLMAHRDRWVVEDRPTRAALTRLTTDERHLYQDLVEDRFGTNVRLEQERVDWAWVGAQVSEL
ncbi:Wadjet anti-phage system protein JetD domain-containing protein [Nocardioides sp. NPDC047086]|uniref:Wadjet anti-phage system protein JetD domain-containing protein n=1 Tax=Nocardioides sp. NPDC047086 TaxID=3154810 RepID=UPI0033E92024